MCRISVAFFPHSSRCNYLPSIYLFVVALAPPHSTYSIKYASILCECTYSQIAQLMQSKLFNSDCAFMLLSLAFCSKSFMGAIERNPIEMIALFHSGSQSQLNIISMRENAYIAQALHLSGAASCDQVLCITSTHVQNHHKLLSNNFINAG